MDFQFTITWEEYSFAIGTLDAMTDGVLIDYTRIIKTIVLKDITSGIQKQATIAA